jgi:hypothetical protein
MRLVVKSTCERDLTQRILRRQHQILGACKATPGDVGKRRYPEAARERAREMRGAQLRYCGKIAHPDRRFEMGLDVGLDAGDLPRCQATPHHRHWRMFVAQAISEQSRCAGNAGARGVTIAIDRFTRLVENTHQHRGEPSALRRLLAVSAVVGGD